jgi:hypothetical protein
MAAQPEQPGAVLWPSMTDASQWLALLMHLTVDEAVLLLCVVTPILCCVFSALGFLLCCCCRKGPAGVAPRGPLHELEETAAQPWMRKLVQATNQQIEDRLARVRSEANGRSFDRELKQVHKRLDAMDAKLNEVLRAGHAAGGAGTGRKPWSSGAAGPPGSAESGAAIELAQSSPAHDARSAAAACSPSASPAAAKRSVAGGQRNSVARCSLPGISRAHGQGAADADGCNGTRGGGSARSAKPPSMSANSHAGKAGAAQPFSARVRNSVSC